jgi:hypothetical protein
MNDRAVLVAAAVVAAVLVSLGALWALRDYARPAFVNGSVMAHQADIMVGDMIAARFPGVRVGAARCPPLLDLTGERSARCTVPVGGDELAVDVAIRRDRHGVDFSDVDALFVTRDGERTIARKLEAMHGERFAVRCPGAAVRVVRRATRVSCDVEAPDVTRREVMVAPYGDRGTVHLDELAGVTTREVRILGAAVARREGGVTVAGPALERYLRGSAAALDGGEVGRRGLVGAAHCPPRVALHEGTHARCTVAVADITLRYDVHFEKGLGLRTDLDTSVVVVPALREFALRYFHHRRLAAHIPYRVDVNCGTVPVIVEEPGSTLRCHADVGGEPFYFAFRFLDAEGGFTMEESNAP